MSETQLRFVLTSKSLRNIQQFYVNKDGAIKIGKESISVSKELAIFVSNYVYLQFRYSNDPFKIETSEVAEASEAEAVKCANKCVSIAEGAEFFELEEKEVPIMRIICGEIRNKELEKQISSLIGDKWPKRITWTSEFLGEFGLLPNLNEFRFYICDKAFPCPKVLAMLLSKKVSHQNAIDSTVTSLKLTLPDGFDRNAYIEAFKSIFNLLSGNTLTISTEKVKIFEAIAKEIECEELLSAIDEFDYTPIDISSIYNCLSTLRIGDQSKRFTETIGFASANFDQLKSENLLSVPAQIIECMLSNPQLKIESKEKLLGFTNAYFEHNGEKGIGILLKVIIEYLDAKTMSETMRTIDIDSMNKDVLASIIRRMICEVTSLKTCVESLQSLSVVKKENDSLKMENQKLQEFQKTIIKYFPIHFKYLKFEGSSVTGPCCISGYESIEVPDGVTEICNEALRSGGFSSVFLPSTLIRIGESAFSDCRWLKSILIPKNVTEICKNTFYNCTSLVSVKIPRSVTEIGPQAFAACSSLTILTIPPNVTKIRDEAFSGCLSLRSVLFEGNGTQIGKNIFKDCPLSFITVPNNSTQIENYNFGENVKIVRSV